MTRANGRLSWKSGIQMISPTILSLPLIFLKFNPTVSVNLSPMLDLDHRMKRVSHGLHLWKVIPSRAVRFLEKRPVHSSHMNIDSCDSLDVGTLGPTRRLEYLFMWPTWCGDSGPHQTVVDGPLTDSIHYKYPYHALLFFFFFFISIDSLLLFDPKVFFEQRFLDRIRTQTSPLRYVSLSLSLNFFFFFLCLAPVSYGLYIRCWNGKITALRFYFASSEWLVGYHPSIKYSRENFKTLQKFVLIFKKRVL